MILEVLVDGEWRRVMGGKAGGLPGTLSNNLEAGREILQFTCFEDRTVVSRSIGGADFEAVGGVARVLNTSGFDPIITLRDGDSYQFRLKTDNMSEFVVARIRHEGGS